MSKPPLLTIFEVPAAPPSVGPALTDRLDAGSLLEPELKKEQITFSALPSPSGSLVDSQIDTGELERLSDDLQSAESFDASRKQYESYRQGPGRTSFLSEIQDVSESAEMSSVRQSTKLFDQQAAAAAEENVGPQQEGLVNMPQVFSSHPFFHFFYLNKTPLSRNEFIGILHSFKSSKQLSSLDAADSTKQSEAPPPETTNPLAATLADPLALSNEWPDFLHLLARMASEALSLYYSSNLLQRISHCGGRGGSFSTGGPKAIFLLMEQNLTRVNNYRANEMTDLLWLNLDIFEALTQRQQELAQALLKDATDFLTTKQGEPQLKTRLLPLTELLLTDMQNTLEELGVYADKFVRLRRDLGNYQFLKEFFKNHFFHSTNSEKKAGMLAQELVRRGPLVKKFLEVLHFNLRGYLFARRRLMVLEELSRTQQEWMVGVFLKRFKSEAELVRALERRRG